MPSIRYYLSERYRLRFEDSGIDMLEEDAEQLRMVEAEQTTDSKAPSDESLDVSQLSIDDAPTAGRDQLDNQLVNGTIKTLNGEIAGDELEQDAINYQILLNRIDRLLGRLKLDA